MRKMIVLLVVFAVLSVATAQAANSSRGLRVSSFKVLYGQRLSITGSVSTHVAGQKVEILAQPFGRALARVATVVSGAGGYWSYRAKPSIQTVYWAQVGAKKSRALTVGVEPELTVSELANGHLLAHIYGAVGFKGRLLQLQQRMPDGAWKTFVQKPIDYKSEALFTPAPTATTVRVAISVNEAGAGYLGSTSNPIRYHRAG